MNQIAPCSCSCEHPSRSVSLKLELADNCRDIAICQIFPNSGGFSRTAPLRRFSESRYAVPIVSRCWSCRPTRSALSWTNLSKADAPARRERAGPTNPNVIFGPEIQQQHGWRVRSPRRMPTRSIDRLAQSNSAPCAYESRLSSA